MKLNNPIRILHVVDGMNRGGAETLIMNVYRQLDRSKVQFDFAVNTDHVCHFDEEIRNLGGRIFSHPRPDLIGFRAYDRAFTETLQKHGPFAGVHSHLYYFSGFIINTARRAGVPLRLSHSHTTQDGVLKTWKRIAYRWYMRRLISQHSTHLLGCTRSACESLFGTGCWEDSRTTVLPNAISLAPFADLPSDRNLLKERLSLPTDVPLIGHVGNFRQEKNHFYMIEIFTGLLQKLPQARLLLVGDGPLRSEIEAKVEAKGIESRVHFLGTRNDVPEIMGALDLFLFPSLYEGFPLSLIEAQASGLPCVVADTVPNDVDLKLGLLQFVSLQAGTEVWAEHILQRINSKRFEWPVLKKTLQSYDIQHMAKTLEERYIVDFTAAGGNRS